MNSSHSFSLLYLHIMFFKQWFLCEEIYIFCVGSGKRDFLNESKHSSLKNYLDFNLQNGCYEKHGHYSLPFSVFS